VFGLGAAVAGVSDQSLASPAPMIVDAHAHCGPLSSLGVRDIPFEEFLAAADQAGISRVCISSVTALNWDADEGNRETWEYAKRYPDRVIGFASMPSPHLAAKGIESIERAVMDWGFRGIGELETNVSDPIDHPGWIPLLERAAQWKTPVLVHGSPASCAAAAVRVPEALILLAHIGTGWGAHQNEWLDAIEVARTHHNVYIETCTSIINAGSIERAVDVLGDQRLVFGTDSPLLDPSVQMAKITGAEISEESKRKILGANMRELLRLG